MGSAGLENRHAVIYGGGAIGGAVARAFAREGVMTGTVVNLTCGSVMD